MIDIKKKKAKMLVKAYADLKATLSDDQMDKAKDLWMGRKGSCSESSTDDRSDKYS